MKRALAYHRAVSAALLLTAGTVAGAGSASAANKPLIFPSAWMPADWDQRVYPGAEPGIDARNQRNFRQTMLQTTPLPLWAIANYNAGWAESVNTVWNWVAAVRSCDLGAQITDDTSGEFGDRNRGQAGLVQAQRDLKAWAATQPKDFTLYFTAKLGQWNQNTGAFLLQEASMATPLPTKQAMRDGIIWDGASVGFWQDQKGQALNHFQSPLTAAQCVSRDGRKIYRFQRYSQWWVVFGDAYIGFGGITSYRTRDYLPPIRLAREAAAALAQRNPRREVEVAVTFLPTGKSFNNGRNQYFVRAKYKKVEVTDALNGAVLVSQSY